MGVPRILIVGAGLTGSAIACRLAHAPVSLTCWDKAKVPGGRMTTKVFGADQVDIGPKYISRKTGDKEDMLFNELITMNVIEPVTYDLDNSHEDNTNVSSKVDTNENSNKEGMDLVGHYNSCWLQPNSDQDHAILMKPENYVTTQGSQSIVNYFFKRSGTVPQTGMFLNELNSVPSDSGDDKTLCWQAVNTERNISQLFDAVIFTIPVPQFMGTDSAVGRPLGSYLSLLQENTDTFKKLEQVSYHSSFTLALFYDKLFKHMESLHESEVKYFVKNKMIKYVSVKPSANKTAEDCGTITIHSHRTWADKNTHLSKAEAGQLIYQEFKNLVSSKGGGSSTLPDPVHMICHKWRYSQTRRPYPGSPRAVTLLQNPLFIGAGDSFTISNVGGCLSSAEIVEQLLKQRFQF